MVFIPGGSFERGRQFEWKDYDVEYYPASHQDDKPVRAITVGPFYLDEAEVTNEWYARFVAGRGHRVPYHWGRIGGRAAPAGKERLPVVNVSWEDAAAFCAWEGKRLPTEAEWERAARGPVGGKMVPWGEEITPAKAVYGQTGGPGAVCGKARNGFGLCDMTGNVWEWCSDWYGVQYYQDSPGVNPGGPGAGIYRVLRGGSWFDEPPLFLTVSYRSWARPEERSPTVGFRCAKTFGGR